MATYAELITLSGNAGLLDQVKVACIVAADTIRAELDTTLNHTARLSWAKMVFESPANTATAMLWAVLAQNRALTVAQISGASDAAVQTAVNSAVNLFAV
jgi:hypothetical protein